MKLPAISVAVLIAVGLVGCEPLAAPPTGAGGRAAATASGLPSGVPPAATRAEPVLPVPAGGPFPDRFPRTSGTSRLAGGAVEWTDFLYDDHGAFGAGPPGGVTGLAPPRGTFTYPDGPARNNGADLFRVGVGLSGAQTYWRIDWTTLDDPRVPIAAFAIDRDRSTATGVGMWDSRRLRIARGRGHTDVV